MKPSAWRVFTLPAIVAMVCFTIQSRDVNALEPGREIPKGHLDIPPPQGFDAAPTLLKGSAPKYSEQLKQKGGCETTTIHFTIDESGRTSDIKVSDVDAPVNAAPVVSAVAQWFFRPAMKQGRPAPIRVSQEFRYCWDEPAVAGLKIDPKALAAFDVTFARCEPNVVAMRGYQDEAFLSLWAVKVDDKVRTQLASVRKSSTYLSERQRVLQAALKRPSRAATGPIEQECQALWADAKRAIDAKQ